MNLYLLTVAINKLQIQTTCKIAELIEAGSMETCLLHSNDIKIPLVIHSFDISFIFRGDEWSLRACEHCDFFASTSRDKKFLLRAVGSLACAQTKLNSG